MAYYAVYGIVGEPPSFRVSPTKEDLEGFFKTFKETFEDSESNPYLYVFGGTRLTVNFDQWCISKGDITVAEIDTSSESAEPNSPFLKPPTIVAESSDDMEQFTLDDDDEDDSI